MASMTAKGDWFEKAKGRSRELVGLGAIGKVYWSWESLKEYICLASQRRKTLVLGATERMDWAWEPLKKCLGLGSH